MPRARARRLPVGPVALDPGDIATWATLTRAGIVRRTPAGFVALCATTGAVVPLVAILHRIPARYRLVPVSGDLLDLRRAAWRFARGSTLPGLRRAHLPPWTAPALVAAERDAVGAATWEAAAPSRDPASYLPAPRSRPLASSYPARVQLRPNGAATVAGYDPIARRPQFLGVVQPHDPDVRHGNVRAAAVARHAAWWAETVAPRLPRPAVPAWPRGARRLGGGAP